MAHRPKNARGARRDKHRHAFKKFSVARLYRLLGVVFLAIVFTYALSRLGTLHGLERLILDWEMGARSRVTNDMVIVQISDREYDEIFGGRSPLDPVTLGNLVGALARSNPKVIGVDIDTSHPFRDLKPDPTWPVVIWERDLLHAAGKEEIEPADILGGQDPSLNAGSGIPALLDDPEDKVTRLYSRCLGTKAGPTPSFVFAVAQAFRDGNTVRLGSLCRDGATSQTPFFIRYSDMWTSMPAEQVRFRSDTIANGGQEQIIPQLREKLVLLGGTYRDFDRHFAPVGTLPGVFVLANAIATELSGDAVQAYPRWVLLLLELSAASVLVLVIELFDFSLRNILLIGLPIVIFVSLIFSAAAFHSFSRITAFAPTLFAVLIIEVIDHLRRRSVSRIIHEG
jgi:CHASE2 domain-containing sensor protein